MTPGAAVERPLFPGFPLLSASAPQVVFLVLAFHFATMVATVIAGRAGDWPQGVLPLMGQWIHVALGSLVLFCFRALRRWCIAQLAVPMPPKCWQQVAAATALNAALPFAVLGAGVAWALVFTPGDPPPGYRTSDPALAWEITLMPARLLHLVLVSWCAGPILEELVFRGLLHQVFEKRWGRVAAAILASLLFGLAHPERMVATGLGGLLLSGVLLRTGSLRACILVHALFNVLLSWPLLGQVLFSPRAGDPASPATWALPLACLAVVSCALPGYLRTATRARPAAAPGR